MVAPANTLSRAERLKIAHNRAARFRSEAFVSYSPEVCGIRLQPVTLDSFNALDAFGNAFFHGGPIGFLDIVNFIWIHHEKFGEFARAEKAECSRQVFRWLNPRFARLNELVWFVSALPRFRWVRIFRREKGVTRFADAVTEIRRIMTEAMQDMPAGERGLEPMPFAFQAYLLNTFRRHLGLNFAETRALPMKQLAEHYRELIHHASGGKAMLLTAEEERIWTEDLGEKNRLAKEAAKAKKETKPRV